MDKYKTFAFTLRPRDGVTDKQIEQICVYSRKNCEYYHVITEKTDDERHVHAAWVMKEPKARSNVATCLIRMFKELADDEKRVMQNGLKIMYNEDWLRKYMDKDDDTVVVTTNLPEAGYLESYFPKKKSQEPAVKKRLQWHSYMIELEGLWREYQSPHLDVNTARVRDFLFDMQYSKRRIGLLDDKKLIQVSRWFTRWMNKAESCLLELPPFEKEEGPGFH